MHLVRLDREMVMAPAGCDVRLILFRSGEDVSGFRRRLMITQLSEGIVRPAALSFCGRRRCRAFGLLLAKLARRQAEAVAEGAAEMRGIAKTVAIGDLRNRAVRLGR